MKNLKKMSRNELKSLKGGAIGCTDNVIGAPYPKTCPCPKGTIRCGEFCIEQGQIC